MISAKLDAETVRDLDKLEAHYRSGTSAVVRLAIAELARQLGLSAPAAEGKAAA
jgi:predicted transcriptional regulator